MESYNYEKDDVAKHVKFSPIVERTIIPVEASDDSSDSSSDSSTSEESIEQNEKLQIEEVRIRSSFNYINEFSYRQLNK